MRLLLQTGSVSSKSSSTSSNSISAHDVAEDGSESLRLRAHGAVAAEATHGTKAPPQAPRLHSVQATVQAGLGRALQYAHQLARKGKAV